MYKHILKNQDGIQTIASIPLVLFFAVFVIAIVWFFIKNKKDNDHMANLPLE
jgi:cbb3-type cytochrome oxidase subunit 3